ncbi:MAG TPA: wax ester/triacylglycerol synthase family O-acyltransferase [Acidimicrobiales bacterium]|nr:wax ester/triacylglycerol synthase family O-acyltransferase [Acidimicrobiales bacterium]
MDGTAEAFMRESDAFSWYMENDPALRATIVAVAWLDRGPAFDSLQERLERATRLVPRFRQRPVDVPGRLSPPRWEFDPGFDLTWHLRRVAAPAPGTPDAVLGLARTIATTGFDRSRPLWEFTLVEQLEGDRAALVMKVHHSLTDGIGGMQLLLLLFDASPDPEPRGEMPPAPGSPALGPAGLVRAGVAHDWRRVTALARRDAAAMVPAALTVARHPVRSTRDAIETARSVGRMVAPVAATLSPVMTARGLGRTLAMITVPFEDLRRSSALAGGTVNDGFLAAVTGGLRRYHERHGATVGDLRVTMPISLRTPDDPAAGNRITLARFTVPAGALDPADRIRSMGQRCRLAREERAVPHSNAIAGTLNLLPQGVVGSMLKHVDFLASNVPGLSFPVYLCGVPTSGYFAFGPTLGSALNVTLVSYAGTCCIGVTVDSAAVPDHAALVECLREGFAEVVALGAGRRARPGHGTPDLRRAALKD